MQPQTSTAESASNFESGEDAIELRAALKCVPVAEKAVISIITRRNAKQRMDIAEAFEKKYSRNLISKLKSKLHGDFKSVCVACFYETAEYEAVSLRKVLLPVIFLSITYVYSYTYIYIIWYDKYYLGI